MSEEVLNNDTAAAAPIAQPVQFTGIENVESPADTAKAPEKVQAESVKEWEGYARERGYEAPEASGSSFVYADLSPEKKAEVDEDIAKLDGILGRYRNDNGVPVESKHPDELTLSERVEVLWKTVFGG